MSFALGKGLTIFLEPLNQRDTPGYFYREVERAVEIIDRLRALFDRIGHVQIAAVPSRAEPDEGEIAFPAIFRALDDLGYRGWVGCDTHKSTH